MDFMQGARGSATRLVIVDDTTPSIIFSGTWGHDQGLPESSRSNLRGPAFNLTSTFTDTISSFSFTFNGTGVSISGGVNFQPASIGDAFAECIIDGIETSMYNSTELLLLYGAPGMNNNALCVALGLEDGTHVLTYRISSIGSFPPIDVSGTANRLWVDSIIYCPSANVALDTVPAIAVFPGDPWLVYSPGWVDIFVTYQKNASITFLFQGTSVDYYYANSAAVGNLTAFATYSIDGEAPTSFVLNTPSTSSITENVPLVRSGLLTAGKHTMMIVNQGDKSDIPLSLAYFILVPSTDSNIDNGNSTAAVSQTNHMRPSTSASISTTLENVTTPTQSNNSATKRINKTSAIAGSIGGLFFIIVLALVFLRWRSHQRASYLTHIYPECASIPPPEVPTAFRLLPHSPVHGFHTRTELARYLRRSPITTSVHEQYPEMQRKRWRRFALSVQNTPPPSEQLQHTFNPSVMEALSLEKDTRIAEQYSRPFSDSIINHDDSGIRLPQPDREAEGVNVIRQVVEFPPSYAP